MKSKHSTKSRRRKPQISATIFNFRVARAAMLDRLADAELQHGHHHAAEHLSRRAAQLREAGR